MSRKVLELQRREQRVLLSKGMREVTALLGEMSNGFKPNTFKAKMAEVSLKLMMASHMQGELRTRIQSGVRLESTLDRAISVMEGRVNASRTLLKEQYQRASLRMAEDITLKTQRMLLKVQTDITAQGLHTDAGVAVLEDAMKRAGVTLQNSYTVENIYRTQMSIAYNAGKYKAEQDPTIQELLWGYTYYTAGDDRVREEHAVLDGICLPKEDKFWTRWYPPNGWSCRCTVVAEYGEADIQRAPRKLPEADESFMVNFGEIL